MLQHTWLSVLRCPKCQGELKQVNIDGSAGLACASDALFFPIRDGLPIMLIEQALPLTVTVTEAL